MVGTTRSTTPGVKPSRTQNRRRPNFRLILITPSATPWKRSAITRMFSMCSRGTRCTNCLSVQVRGSGMVADLPASCLAAGRSAPSLRLGLEGQSHLSPDHVLPVLVDPSLIGSDGRANPAFFTNPVAGTFGGLSLTPVDGPGYWSADAALIKRTKFKENLNLELRLEAFNIFNHTNFSVDNVLDINSTNFGKITSTSFGGNNNERIIQLAFKFNF